MEINHLEDRKMKMQSLRQSQPSTSNSGHTLWIGVAKGIPDKYKQRTITK